jgi:hypothetical protein
VRLRNAGASDRLATLEFEIGSVTERTVVIRSGGVERRVAVSGRQPTPVRLGPVTLSRDERWWTSRPTRRPGPSRAGAS